jgi:3-hydroxyisobutyrate dehydrogenase
MKVGYIGLGTMGSGMARNLQKAGNELVVHDIRRETGDEYVAAGAIWANSPREVGEQCDVVFTSLPGPPEVRAVANGPDGLFAGMKRGSTWFDMSTNSPTLIRELEAQFAEKGISVLDAPVSGGPAGAANGTLAIWVGGSAAEFEKNQDLLNAMGDAAKYIGPIGAGSVAKLVHNCAGYIIQTALAECFAMGVKGGVDPLALIDAVRHVAGGRRRTFDQLGAHVTGIFDPPSFALRLAHKDVTLAVELGKELGVPMRLANLAREELTEAMNRGWAGLDSRVAVLLEHERAGLHFEVPLADVQEVLNRP